MFGICEQCGKRKGGPKIECIYCNLKFCCNCIQLEIHNCKNIYICIEKQKKQINNKLLETKDASYKDLSQEPGNAY